MRIVPLLAILLACGGPPPTGGDAARAPAPEPAAAPAPPHGALADHMDEHLARLTAARDALIKGDVLGAQEPMKWLAEHEPPDGLPENWRPYVERLRATARSAAGSTNPDTLGKSIAAAANACGECHEANGVEVPFEEAPAPDAAAGLTAQMRRHAWAADRMWEALIGPDPEGWVRAAEVLSSQPFPESPEAKLMTSEARMIATEQYEAGVKTLTAGSQMERLELYGTFLAGCGKCHVRTSGGPE